MSNVPAVKNGDVVTLLVGCRRGWRYFRRSNSCFYTSSRSLNLVGARSECQSMDSDLPSIESQEEMDFLVSIS